MFGLYISLGNDCCFFHLLPCFATLCSSLNFISVSCCGYKTVEVKSKLHTGPQSVLLMKRFRINRGEERPTL